MYKPYCTLCLPVNKEIQGDPQYSVEICRAAVALVLSTCAWHEFWERIDDSLKMPTLKFR